MSDKITAPKVQAMKSKGIPIVCLTAYDVYFGALADKAGVDVVLVGDSLGNVLLGYDSTVPVELEEMIHHTKATSRGVKRALLVADLPFGSYQESSEQAVRSAVALMKAGAEAVKLEGDYAEAVQAITRAGIPVMGHLGMTPQSVNKFGGHKVQGRGEGAESIVRAAEHLEQAGAFSIVLELMPAGLAKRITCEIGIPTIGIGAGPHCDGQIQVIHDILGFADKEFKHAKRYAEGGQISLEGIKEYAQEVRAKSFPTQDHSF